MSSYSDSIVSSVTAVMIACSVLSDSSDESIISSLLSLRKIKPAMISNLMRKPSDDSSVLSDSASVTA